MVLVHAGTKEELMVKDKSGFTPAQLASDKGHGHVAYILVSAYSVLIITFRTFHSSASNN